MKKIIVSSSLCILLVLVSLGSIACGGTTGDTVAKEVYDALQAQLTAAQSEIANLKVKATAVATTSTSVSELALQDEVARLQSQVKELGEQITALSIQYNNLIQEKESLETKYAELTAEYQDLERKLALTTLPDDITIDEVENAVLSLLNQERVKAGVGDFL